jgi:hypothetical protein
VAATAACYGDAPPLSLARFSFTIFAGGTAVDGAFEHDRIRSRPWRVRLI